MWAVFTLLIALLISLLIVFASVAHASCTTIIDNGQIITVCCTGNICQVIR